MGAIDDRGQFAHGAEHRHWVGSHLGGFGRRSDDSRDANGGVASVADPRNERQSLGPIAYYSDLLGRDIPALH